MSKFWLLVYLDFLLKSLRRPALGLGPAIRVKSRRETDLLSAARWVDLSYLT